MESSVTAIGAMAESYYQARLSQLEIAGNEVNDSPQALAYLKAFNAVFNRVATTYATTLA